MTVNGDGVSGLCVLDVELRAQWIEGGGIGLPVLGVPHLRIVGLLEQLVVVCLGLVGDVLRGCQVGDRCGDELEDLAPVLGLLDRGDGGGPGQGDGAESSGVGPGQRREDVAQVAILGSVDPVEGDQVAGEEGADSPGQGGEGVSLSVAVECFVQTVAGTVTETVQVDRELGERDNMEDEDELGITLVAVTITEENGGTLDFDKEIYSYKQV